MKKQTCQLSSQQVCISLNYILYLVHKPMGHREREQDNPKCTGPSKGSLQPEIIVDMDCIH
jgi:hypothetical protein